MKLYHATYGAYLDSILKYGLIRGYRKNWDFSENYVYLTNDPEIAISFAETSDTVAEEFLADIVIFEIDSKDLKLAKLKVDDNITQDEEDNEPYSFQYREDISPQYLKVYGRVKNDQIKKAFDKAIINPYNNLGLSEILNDVIKEYRDKEYICDKRGQCYEESNNFVFWLQDNYTDLFEELKEYGLQVVYGIFEIDNPALLPLELQDLEKDEYEEFLDLYEEDIDLNDEEELSDTIWEYITENADDSRIESFYMFDHAWVDIDGLIIDFTWAQFIEAIEDTGNLADRYQY